MTSGSVTPAAPGRSGTSTTSARAGSTDHGAEAFTLDPDQEYPACVAYQGDSPVEYPSEEDPEEPTPFSLTDVNRMLAALGR